jgi:hypothetical protein
MDFRLYDFSAFFQFFFLLFNKGGVLFDLFVKFFKNAFSLL